MENMERKHLLVVDDERNMLQTLKFILETANYRVTTAVDGQEALEEILAAQESYRPINLLITDIRMPGLTGLQLIDELNYLNIKMPILVITAYGDKTLFIKLMRAGCADYLDKPFDSRELVRRVGLLVERAET
jgi:DNA-binding response OmpR family regulator